jgi:hypothetical protein
MTDKDDPLADPKSLVTKYHIVNRDGILYFWEYLYTEEGTVVHVMNGPAYCQGEDKDELREQLEGMLAALDGPEVAYDPEGTPGMDEGEFKEVMTEYYRYDLTKIRTKA